MLLLLELLPYSAQINTPANEMATASARTHDRVSPGRSNTENKKTNADPLWYIAVLMATLVIGRDRYLGEEER